MRLTNENDRRKRNQNEQAQPGQNRRRARFVQKVTVYVNLTNWIYYMLRNQLHWKSRGDDISDYSDYGSNLEAITIVISRADQDG